MDFSLPRPPATALREYVPGNLIYANGHRFVARRFHRELHDAAETASQTAGADSTDMPVYQVSVERQAVRETRWGETSSLSGTVLRTMAVCDVDMIHTSHISDEEDLRFQLGVAVYETELGQHNGGQAFRWESQPMHLRRGARLRLVNVGAAGTIENELGYPVCTICGQSVSPLSSERQREDFHQKHTDHCGRAPDGIGFHADVTANVLSLPRCPRAMGPRPRTACWKRCGSGRRGCLTCIWRTCRSSSSATSSGRRWTRCCGTRCPADRDCSTSCASG